ESLRRRARCFRVAREESIEAALALDLCSRVTLFRWQAADGHGGLAALLGSAPWAARGGAGYGSKHVVIACLHTHELAVDERQDRTLLGQLQAEVLDQHVFRSLAQAESALSEYAAYFNYYRLHASSAGPRLRNASTAHRSPTAA